MQHIINLQLLANNTNFSKFKSFDSTAKVYEIDLFANKKLASLNQQPTRLIDRAKKAFSAGVQIGGVIPFWFDLSKSVFVRLSIA